MLTSSNQDELNRKKDRARTRIASASIAVTEGRHQRDGEKISHQRSTSYQKTSSFIENM